MPQEFNLKEAIRLAIQTEKDVMDFYNKAAALTKNERGRKVFEQLAKEEREHASHFFSIYPGKDLGSFEEFMAQPARIEQVMLRRAAKRPGDRRLIGRVLCSSPHEQAQTDLLRCPRESRGRVSPRAAPGGSRLRRRTRQAGRLAGDEGAHALRCPAGARDAGLPGSRTFERHPRADCHPAAHGT